MEQLDPDQPGSQKHVPCRQMPCPEHPLSQCCGKEQSSPPKPRSQAHVPWTQTCEGRGGQRRAMDEAQAVRACSAGMLCGHPLRAWVRGARHAGQFWSILGGEDGGDANAGQGCGTRLRELRRAAASPRGKNNPRGSAPRVRSGARGSQGRMHRRRDGKVRCRNSRGSSSRAANPRMRTELAGPTRPACMVQPPRVRWDAPPMIGSPSL